MHGTDFALHRTTPIAIEETSQRDGLVLLLGRASIDLIIGNRNCMRYRLQPGNLLLARRCSHHLVRPVDRVEFRLTLLDLEGVRRGAETAGVRDSGQVAIARGVDLTG